MHIGWCLNCDSLALIYDQEVVVDVFFRLKAGRPGFLDGDVHGLDLSSVTLLPALSTWEGAITISLLSAHHVLAQKLQGDVGLAQTRGVGDDRPHIGEIPWLS